MCYCSQLYGKSVSASIVKTNSMGFLDLRDIQPVNVIPDRFLHFFRSSLDLCVCEIWLVEEGSILQQALRGFSGKEIFSFHQVFFSWQKKILSNFEKLQFVNDKIYSYICQLIKIVFFGQFYQNRIKVFAKLLSFFMSQFLSWEENLRIRYNLFSRKSEPRASLILWPCY